MEVTAMAWRLAQVNPNAGPAPVPPTPSSTPDDQAAADFSRALDDRVGPEDGLPGVHPPQAGGHHDEIANVPEGGPLTIGDAILRGLSAIGKDITGGWNRLRLPIPVGEGGLPSAAEMFTRQVELAVTSFTLEVATKGTGKAVEHVNQIVKQQ